MVRDRANSYPTVTTYAEDFHTEATGAEEAIGDMPGHHVESRRSCQAIKSYGKDKLKPEGSYTPRETRSA